MDQTMPLGPLTQTTVASKKFDLDRKRFQELIQQQTPQLILNAEGMIQQLNEAARRLLEYPPDRVVRPSFFSHVHQKNLYQVMRDVADMVCYGKSQATWLLRLRTGKDRWRWYRVSVDNRLQQPDGTLILTLRDLPS